MFLEPPGNVVGEAGIIGAVAALNDINEILAMPFHINIGDASLNLPYVNHWNRTGADVRRKAGVGGIAGCRRVIIDRQRDIERAGVIVGVIGFNAVGR